MRQSGNVVDAFVNAANYVAAPSFAPDKMDFYPLNGKCQGPPLDLSLFDTDTAYGTDFNGTSKVAAGKGVIFRGAYAGEGANPGWRPRDEGLKPPLPPKARRSPSLLWVAPSGARPGTTVKLELSGMDFEEGDRVEISGGGVSVGSVGVVSANHMSVSLKIAAGLTGSRRDVTVVTASGKSNSMRFDITAAH
jgi:hypothetical protein